MLVDDGIKDKEDPDLQEIQENGINQTISMDKDVIDSVIEEETKSRQLNHSDTKVSVTTKF